ncbi:cysteinyl leukotriene receptor 1-like [Mustelus asterias]
MAIVILSRDKCGLSMCTTRYLVAMAVADLLLITTDVILWRVCYYYFPESFLDITYVCSLILVLSRAARNCSVWFTVAFSFDRTVAICCQKLKVKFCKAKVAGIVLATTCILLCLRNVPFIFTYEPGRIVNNVPFFCRQKSSYYTDPRWVVFDWFDTILSPLLPFISILLLNALTVTYILVASRIRKGLRGQRKSEERRDPEIESRRKSIILLFTISGSFIFLWLITVVDFFYYTFAGSNPNHYVGGLYFFRDVGVMLANFSCCTNTFIYVVTQSRFREQFKILFKYPVTTITHFVDTLKK